MGIPFIVVHEVDSQELRPLARIRLIIVFRVFPIFLNRRNTRIANRPLLQCQEQRVDFKRSTCEFIVGNLKYAMENSESELLPR